MKKIILLIFITLFLVSCSSTNIDNVESNNDSLKFVDERGYILTLHYSESKIVSADWVIVTDEEGASKLLEYYSESDEFEVNVDKETVILEYTDVYLDKEYGSVSKENMEEYLEKKGYEIIKE